MGKNGNMILMALLTGVFIVLGLSFFNHLFFHEQKAGKDFPIVGDVPGGAPIAVAQVADPMCELLAEADISIGETIARANCAACHQFEQPIHGQGPHLVGIVGRDFAATDFGGYSSAIGAFNAAWDQESLNEFLFKPSAYIPGTAMNFAGLDNSKSRQRAAIVAYLYSVSGAELPVCEVAEEMMDEEMMDDEMVDEDAGEDVVDAAATEEEAAS